MRHVRHEMLDFLSLSKLGASGFLHLGDYT